MSQADSEQQLRIWKDLAISKQVLMNEAASALKLKEDFSADDLRSALDQAIKRAADADANMVESRNRAAEEIGSMQMEVKKIIKSRTEAEAQRDAALAEKEASEKALIIGRKDNTDAVQKAKRQVDEKQRELKAINTALADTPDNILKKLKTLRKQKIDEANARTKAEDANRKLKKENKQQKEELETLSELKEQAASLLAAYRELRTWSDEMEAKTEDCEAAPKVDSKLLSDIETTTAGADEAEDKKESKKEAATA
ncbi:MAG: colicin import membrane protein [Granulosicoccus sp.]